MKHPSKKQNGQIDEKLLASITNRIVSALEDKIEKIVLFGSYAYGDPKTASDLDLLIVLRTKKSATERHLLIERLFRERQIPMDFVVLTPQDIRRRSKWVDPFLHEILEKGRVLYARS